MPVGRNRVATCPHISFRSSTSTRHVHEYVDVVFLARNTRSELYIILCQLHLHFFTIHVCTCIYHIARKTRKGGGGGGGGGGGLELEVGLGMLKGEERGGGGGGLEVLKGMCGLGRSSLLFSFNVRLH